MEEHSEISGGSDFNQRSFENNESWSSLQSTVLAGHLNMGKQAEKIDISIAREEKYSIGVEEDEEDENILNVNLDAIDDNVFLNDQADSPLPNVRLMNPLSNDDSGVEHEVTLSPDVKSYRTISSDGLSRKRLDFERDSLMDSNSSNDSHDRSKTCKNLSNIEDTNKYINFKSETNRTSRMSKKSSPTFKIFSKDVLSKKSKIPVRKRTASCSEHTSTDKPPKQIRSKSTGEVVSGAGKLIETTHDVKLIIVKKKRIVSLSKSPMRALISRKSLVKIVSSPIKSIRKILSPMVPKEKTLKLSTAKSSIPKRATATASDQTSKKLSKRIVPKITIVSYD